MTLKEQKLLVELEKQIMNALLIANPDCIVKEICEKHLQEYDSFSGEGKIKLMLEQFSNLTIYLKYQCLDVEAGRRDIAFLLGIINHYEEQMKNLGG